MKPKLILLHGALGAYEQMYKLRERLSDHYEIDGFSLKGHGENADSDGFTIQDFVEQLEDFIAKKNWKEYYILGYSLGGYVALNFALKHPVGLKKVMTFGTKLIWSEEFACSETDKLKPEILEAHMPPLADWMKKVHGEKYWSKVVYNTADLMNTVGKHNYLMNQDLSSLTCPILITQGTEDPMVPIQESELFSSKIKSSSLHLFQGVGHEPNALTDEQLKIFVV
jgi:pimeloyl-ACP methyl ester carboxylesterase